MELSGALLKQDGTLKRDFCGKYKKMYCLYHWLANRISCLNYIKELGLRNSIFVLNDVYEEFSFQDFQENRKY